MEAFVSVNILRFDIFGPKDNEIFGSISQGRFFEVPPQNCRSVLTVNALIGYFREFFHIYNLKLDAERGLTDSNSKSVDMKDSNKFWFLFVWVNAIFEAVPTKPLRSEQVKATKQVTFKLFHGSVKKPWENPN